MRIIPEILSIWKGSKFYELSKKTQRQHNKIKDAEQQLLWGVVGKKFFSPTLFINDLFEWIL